MAFATFAVGGLFFSLKRQQWRREAVSGAEDGGWPAGTTMVPGHLDGFDMEVSCGC